MSKPIEVTDDTFETEVKKSDVPVLVDFWAAWCAPCMMIAPAVEEIAGQYSGRLKVAKMDVDSNPRTPASFSIMSIPCLLIFKDGRVIDQIVGLVPKMQLVTRVERALS